MYIVSKLLTMKKITTLLILFITSLTYCQVSGEIAAGSNISTGAGFGSMSIGYVASNGITGSIGWSVFTSKKKVTNAIGYTVLSVGYVLHNDYRPIAVGTVGIGIEQKTVPQVSIMILPVRSFGVKAQMIGSDLLIGLLMYAIL